MDKKDKIIRNTDLDALSCRASADKYLNDPLVTKLVDGVKYYAPFSQQINFSIQRAVRSQFQSPKTPVINRGTYIRTRSIDIVVNKFINRFKELQIVSIGAGSDTRFLNLLRSSGDRIKVYEFDFEPSVKIKKLTIVNDRELSDIVHYKGEATPVNSYEEFAQVDPVLDTENYSLMPIDLRQLDSNSLAKLDPTIPTLILSECVLCYMSIEDSNKVVDFFTSYFLKGLFLIYEPMGGEDNFGRVMTQNLSSRGIELPSLLKYQNLHLQRARFESFNKFDKVQISDLKYIFSSWIPANELLRINRLEFLDEIEELNLMNAHYCLCALQWGGLSLELDQKFQIDK